MGVDGDHARADLGKPTPAVGEEVAEWHLDCRLIRVVPVRPEYQGSPVVGVRGEPDMGDQAGTVDDRQSGTCCLRR